MKRLLTPTLLVLLTIILAACGGDALQTPAEVEQPTQAEAQPVQPLPSDTAAPVVEAATTEAPTEAPTEAAAVDPSAGVSYVNDVYPIFEASCVKCHGVESTKEGLDMLTYDNLLSGSRNGPVVVPGNANESVLVELIVKGKMPNRGPDLPADQIQIITDWINQGALNN